MLHNGGGERHLLVHRRNSGREIFTQPIAASLRNIGGEDYQATTTEHAKDLGNRALRTLHVMESEGSHRTVEAAIAKREQLRVSLQPSDAIAFGPRLRQHRRSQFEPV